MNLYFTFSGVGRWKWPLMKSFKSKYSCDDCRYSSSKRSNLIKHIVSKQNKNPVFPCDWCKSDTDSFFSLLWHRESVDQDSVFSCEVCDYIGTSPASQRYHIQIKHQGLNYPCIHCDYASKSATFLKRHINRKQIVCFPCAQCDHGATSPGSLMIHVFNKHKKVK